MNLRSSRSPEHATVPPAPRARCSRRAAQSGAALTLLMAVLLTGCVGGNGTTAAGNGTVPVLNTLTLTVDGGPAAASGAINRAFVTVKVCAPGSTTQCASIDHVRLDTGSWGLRLVGSVLAAANVTLGAETDAQGQSIGECATFSGGQTWGPVVTADVLLAGEKAAKLPLQLLDDSGAFAPAPATCGANGTLINAVPALGANGILGIGVLAQDCGSGCVSAAVPLPVYYGCSAGAAGTCSAENLALSAQVTNPVTYFASDNNGVIVDLPSLVNANGDVTDSGTLIFGLGTQTDNALPATGLTVLGTDSSGNFTATYNGNPTVLPARIDSGSEDYGFSDPTITVCSSGAFIGYYCPAGGLIQLSAVNMGVGVNNASSTLSFAVADPNLSFLAGSASFAGLGGGQGSGYLTWGLPFFYGRKVYVGIDQHVAGTYTGPYFAY